MKRSAFGLSVLSLLATLMLVAVPPVAGQSRMIAQVPFNFSVGPTSMAAGKYEIVSLSAQVEEIRNMDNDCAQLVLKSILERAAAQGLSGRLPSHRRGIAAGAGRAAPKPPRGCPPGSRSS